jgi:hypothetical protein
MSVKFNQVTLLYIPGDNAKGNQKVLEIVVMHFNGITYCNAYLFTFRLRSLRSHKLAPSMLPLLESPAEGFFSNLPEFGSRIQFDILPGCETCHLEANFQSREQQKSLGARSREYGGWVTTGTEQLHNK